MFRSFIIKMMMCPISCEIPYWIGLVACAIMFYYIGKNSKKND